MSLFSTGCRPGSSLFVVLTLVGAAAGCGGTPKSTPGIQQSDRPVSAPRQPANSASQFKLQTMRVTATTTPQPVFANTFSMNVDTGMQSTGTQKFNLRDPSSTSFLIIDQTILSPVNFPLRVSNDSSDVVLFTASGQTLMPGYEDVPGVDKVWRWNYPGRTTFPIYANSPQRFRWLFVVPNQDIQTAKLDIAGFQIAIGPYLKR